MFEMDETKRMFAAKLDEFMAELKPLISIAPQSDTRDLMVAVQSMFIEAKVKITKESSLLR